MIPPNRFAVILIVLFGAAISHSAVAGSGTARLTCTSASGKTTFSAFLQDITGIFEGGTLTIDGESISFPEAGNCDTGDVVWDPENGVFTISFMHGAPDGPIWFRFWALPGTFRIISKDRGSANGAIYEFDGVIESKEPRPDKSLITPRIKLSCRLEYKI
ncbi:MAG: hypothetical protein QY325_00270 [Flavobacteriales bacterium]|jgi:hypothetical protein|nr:MAG: hypothetical protein QY325_00270 [Flavobacteriales bacterium]